MFRREYFPSDAIKLINQSEGRLGISGKAAHAMSEHLLKKAPGALVFDPAASLVADGVRMARTGTSDDEFRDRFKAAPGTANSGWLGKGDMVLLLTELLNSDVGQEALGALDSGVQRVEVHYLNLKKAAKLFGGLGNVGMQTSYWYVQPAVFKDEATTVTKKDGTSVTFNKKVTVSPKTSVAVVKPVDMASVHAVLDNLGGDLHVQTLFPDNQTIESHAKWLLGAGKVTLTVGVDGTVKKDFKA